MGDTEQPSTRNDVLMKPTSHSPYVLHRHDLFGGAPCCRVLRRRRETPLPWHRSRIQPLHDHCIQWRRICARWSAHLYVGGGITKTHCVCGLWNMQLISLRCHVKPYVFENTKEILVCFWLRRTRVNAACVCIWAVWRCLKPKQENWMMSQENVIKSVLTFQEVTDME